MKKLNIPKGKWKLNIHEAIVDEHDYGIAQVHGILNEAMWKDTATLIADAGTTYNTAPILPSELLKQRNELLEALQNIIDNCSTNSAITVDVSKLYIHEAKQAIKNATNENH